MDLHVGYWNGEKDRANVNYLNSFFMWKSSAVDVLEHFNSCLESIENPDGMNVSLSFLKILDEHGHGA